MPLWYTSNIFAWEIMFSNSSDISMPKEICWQMESKLELCRPELTIKTSSSDWWSLLSASYPRALWPKLTVAVRAMATKLNHNWSVYLIKSLSFIHAALAISFFVTKRARDFTLLVSYDKNSEVIFFLKRAFQNKYKNYHYYA